MPTSCCVKFAMPNEFLSETMEQKTNAVLFVFCPKFVTELSVDSESAWASHKDSELNKSNSYFLGCHFKSEANNKFQTGPKQSQ